MKKIKITVTNNGSKHTQYHYKGSSGGISVGKSNDIMITVGDTLYFENDGGKKYAISESDAGRTIYYSK